MRAHLQTLSMVLLLAASPVFAQEAKKWRYDISLYGMAAGMSGDATVRGIDADVDMGFDDIVDNLEFGFMGTFRIGYERWSLSTDVIYMGLGASKNSVSVDVDQWVVEPTLNFRVSRYFEALAGVRYNNLKLEISGPFGREPSGTQDWWDPIVGGKFTLPIGERFSFNLRGDIGGFGVGSDLTWQAYPYFNWQCNQWFSLQAGYRLLYNDYSEGDGFNEFRYDVLSHGPQLGMTFSF